MLQHEILNFEGISSTWSHEKCLNEMDPEVLLINSDKNPEYKVSMITRLS